MIKLLIAAPGNGKTHWLREQPTDAYVDCTTKSHRAALSTIADALHCTYPSRASIDDLIQLILTAPSTTIAFDNIDRTSQKLCYSLLTLSTKHKIFCTATERRRVKPLLDRQAAILIPPPPVKIEKVVAEHYPNLSPQETRRIAALTDNPAAALNIAASVQAGQPLPAPPAQSLFPLILIASITAIAFLRYYSPFELSPIALALISGIAFYIRRLLWKHS